MNQSNPQDGRMIIRANHDAQNRFFLVRRATAQDERLTSRARGVLCYLLSKPDGWEVSIQNLKREFPDLGRDAAYQVINELISNGYAKRIQVRDEKTGKLGQLRIDIYEMPLTDFQEAATPLPALPDTASPDTASPDTAKPEHIRNRVQQGNRAAKETEQQQQTDAAAAASRFDLATVKAYVQSVKTHATNPGGLAVHLWRTGEEDADIEHWQQRQHRKTEDLNQTPFDPWTRQQYELAAHEAERQWLANLDADFYTHAFREAAEEFQRRFPQHARASNWQSIHRSAIETLIITNYYREEIAA